MLYVVAFALGMIFGWRRAVRRGGDFLDRLQYGAAHGIAFIIAALALFILAERLGFI